MATMYFGFGISDSMFTGDVTVTRKEITDPGYVDYLLRNPNSAYCEKLVSCLNPSHQATIDAMVKRYGISSVEIPEVAPRVSLEPGDVVIVMSPRGLPRLQDRHEYTDEEIEKATFAFSSWQVGE